MDDALNARAKEIELLCANQVDNWVQISGPINEIEQQFPDQITDLGVIKIHFGPYAPMSCRARARSFGWCSWFGWADIHKFGGRPDYHSYGGIKDLYELDEYKKKPSASKIYKLCCMEIAKSEQHIKRQQGEKE